MTEPPRPLTKRQTEMLALIQSSIATRGYAPTLRELARMAGIGSTNGVDDHLCALERKGYLERDCVRARGMRLTAKARAVFFATCCPTCGQAMPSTDLAASKEVA